MMGCKILDGNFWLITATNSIKSNASNCV